MRIEILSFDEKQGTNVSGKPYTFGEVAYKNIDSGKIEGKKVMEFVNKEVFSSLRSAPKNVPIDIQTSKNAKSGYWDWVGVGAAGAAPVAASGTAPARGNVAPRSNYETPEERAARQVYIVRQSSVSAAVALSSQGKAPATPEQIIEVAKQFEEYVFSSEGIGDSEGGSGFDSMSDDIPY